MKRIAFLFIILLPVSATKVFCQNLGLETIYQTDCNNHLIPPKLIVNTDYLTANKIKLKKVVFEGFVDVKAAPDLQYASGIFIANDEYAKYFANGGLPTEVYGNFLNSFNGGLPQDQSSVFVLTDAKTHTITFFHLEKGVIRGYPHNLDIDGCISANKIAAHEVETAKKRNIPIVWYGDDIEKFKLRELADASELTVYRRGVGIHTALPTDISKLSKDFDADNTAFLNAIPNNKRAIFDAGYNSSNAEYWRGWYGQINDLAGDLQKNSITSKADFKQELLNGDKDVMIVFAHLKGTKLYFGKEQLTYDEILSWGKREKPTGGKRVGFLFICNSGKQDYRGGGIFFKKELGPIANIFLDNEYFDMVVAPDHTIDKEETSKIFKQVLGKDKKWEYKAEKGKKWWWMVDAYSKKSKPFKS